MKKSNNCMATRYCSGDEGCEGIYSERSLYRLWKVTVDKSIYPTYKGWKWDMLRSGTFKRFGRREKKL